VKVTPIVERIESGIRDFRKVDGLDGLAALDDQSFVPPAVFVSPLAESAQDNSRAGGGATRQVVTVTFAIVVVIAGQARHGVVVNEQLDDLTRAVKERLRGWVVPGASSETIYRRGKLLRAAGGQIAWQMDFEYRQQELSP